MLLKDNIYIDPLTGLYNFFSLVEADTKQIFYEQGAFVIFDIIGFKDINSNYGRDIGDLCLKTLSQTVSTSVLKYEEASAYRTDGDEFTLILPYLSHGYASQIASQIRTNFIGTLYNFGLSSIDVRILTIGYSDHIESISQFYQIVLKHTMHVIESSEDKLQQIWLKSIVDSFIRRITDTLGIFNQAFNLAHMDDISGLPNNRAANRYFNTLMKMNEESEKSFTILFIDGDNLRRYNKISYERGNIMIGELAQVLVDSIRKKDRVFRWLSGDEFLVVLEDMSQEDALKLAERIRQEVAEQTKVWIFPITVSIGVASYPNDGTNITEVISKAEQAHIMAKNKGKNRVEKWESGIA